jgi:hypothetical protein
MIELFSIIVFGEGQRSSSFSHPFRHWNYFLRLFYSIENTVVIPVNLKIGYEFTVLSCAIFANACKNRVSTEGQSDLVEM